MGYEGLVGPGDASDGRVLVADGVFVDRIGSSGTIVFTVSGVIITQWSTPESVY